MGLIEKHIRKYNIHFAIVNTIFFSLVILTFFLLHEPRNINNIINGPFEINGTSIEAMDNPLDKRYFDIYKGYQADVWQNEVVREKFDTTNVYNYHDKSYFKVSTKNVVDYVLPANFFKNVNNKIKCYLLKFGDRYMIVTTDKKGYGDYFYGVFGGVDDEFRQDVAEISKIKDMSSADLLPYALKTTTKNPFNRNRPIICLFLVIILSGLYNYIRLILRVIVKKVHPINKQLKRLGTSSEQIEQELHELSDYAKNSFPITTQNFTISKRLFKLRIDSRCK